MPQNASGSQLGGRRHHIVPQFYLRGFTALDGASDQVWVHDLARLKGPFRTAIANVACERDFYRLEEAAPEDPLVIEKALELGGEVAAVLDSIRASQCLPAVSCREWIVFMNFVALLLVRTRRLRELLRAMAVQWSRATMEAATASAEKWTSEVASTKAHVPGIEAISYEAMRDFVDTATFDADVSEVHSANIASILDGILPALMDRQWSLFKAPVGGATYVTSDEPVGLHWSDSVAGSLAPRRPPGLSHRNTELLLPLSSDLMAVAKFEGQSGNGQHSPDEVAAANWHVARTANQVYSATDRVDVLRGNARTTLSALMQEERDRRSSASGS